MADDIELVVLKDPSGEYFVLPRASIEGGRVPKEHRAELEKMIASGATQGSQGELDMEQLGAVTGGVSSVGTLTVSSNLAGSIQDTWNVSWRTP